LNLVGAPLLGGARLTLASRVNVTCDITQTKVRKKKRTNNYPLTSFACVCTSLSSYEYKGIKALAQAPGSKVPSQRLRKHRAPRHNNQNDAIALTHFSFLADDAFLAPSASTGHQEKIWAPSQRVREHQEVPRRSASTGHQDNNQNGAIALTSYSFLEMMMLSWCPAQALGAKKRQGRLHSTRTSTRRCQGVHEYQDTTINMVLCFSLFCFTFSGIILFNINSFDIHYRQQYG
jgi:hypothetical protein